MRALMTQNRRIGVFGWGIVAPKSPNIDAFEKNLAEGGSWLSTFEGFGPSNFLVGTPDFRLADYKAWIDARFPPARFGQLESKLGSPVHYAVGSFIQSLGQNPGIEEELQKLGTQAHVYFGTGLGDIQTQNRVSLDLYRAQKSWNRFWANPERNRVLRAHLEGKSPVDGIPATPEGKVGEERELAQEAWDDFWMRHSAELREYLAELREIEILSVSETGDVEQAKVNLIREKRKKNAALQKKWGAPEPPWNAVSANLVWNIPNAAASQISMLGKITGMTFAPVAACSTFGYTLRLAHQAISSGAAKAVVIGAADAAPTPLLVGGFYNARVTAADGSVSYPLTSLKGTHVSGGAVTWIVGDYEYMTARGFKPLGLEPVTVGVNADAHHIITPSHDGPAICIQQALDEARLSPDQVVAWDLHATGTPGDLAEVETLRSKIPEQVLVTARKGTFGHGMSACGGWELTAQYLGYQRGRLFPVPLKVSEIHQSIQSVHPNYVTGDGAPAPKGVAGKLSMGVGGINACVLSRPWS